MRFFSFLFLVLFAAWAVGLVEFSHAIPRQGEPRGEYDAIVVLTGGRGRLDYGLQLLEQGRAQRLFITGVHNDADLAALYPNGGSMEPGTLPPGIELGHAALDTVGNAEETEAWLESNPGMHDLLLVTATYHMPRSLQEFRHLLPERNIQPAPVEPPGFNGRQWWRDKDSARLVLLEYHKYIARKLWLFLIARA